MSTHPRRCPSCQSVMPLARKLCPNCKAPLPVGDETRSIESIFLDKKLSGKFEIVSQLHSRGTATLFLAQDLILDHKVVIKALYFGESSSDEILNRWRQNAHRSIRLDHPNVVRNFSFDSAGPLNYFITQYSRDGSLLDYLDKDKVVPIWESLRIVRDIARGVHSAHNLGLCHHRIKLSNVTFPLNGFCQVMDFGSSQSLLDALAGKPWTPDNDSSLYLSPEQIETGLSDQYSDQYSIGVILYRLVTGVFPFSDPGEKGALDRLTRAPIPASTRNNAVPEKLSLIINQTLAIDPQTRYQNCAELVEALESLDHELWLPDRMEIPGGTGIDKIVEILLENAAKAKQNRDYRKAFFMCEQALVLDPYSQEVTHSLANLRKLVERKDKVQRLINKGISAFYEKRMDTALTALLKAKQIDKDNPEVIRLTHDVLQEQERLRLANVLIQTARIDISQNALTQAMAKVVKIQDIDPGNQEAAELKHQIESVMEDSAAIGIMLSKAEKAFQSDRIDQAEKFLTDIFQMCPDLPEAKDLRGRISDMKRNSELLVLKKELQKYIQTDSKDNIIKTLQKIAKLDSTLADDLHQKITQLKNALALSDTVIYPKDHSLMDTVIYPSDPAQTDTRIIKSVHQEPEMEIHELIPIKEIEISESTNGDLMEEPDSIPKEQEHQKPEEVPVKPVKPKVRKSSKSKHVPASSVIMNVEEPPKPDTVPDKITDPPKSISSKPVQQNSDAENNDTNQNPGPSSDDSEIMDLGFSLAPEKKHTKYPLYAGVAGIIIILIFLIIFTFKHCGQSEAQLIIIPTANPEHLIPSSPTPTPTPSPSPKRTATPSPSPTETPVPENTVTPSPSIDKKIVSLLNTAARYEKIKMFPQAADYYKRVLKIQRDNISAQNGFARCSDIMKSKANKAAPVPSPTPTKPVPLASNSVPPSPTAKPAILTATAASQPEKHRENLRPDASNLIRIIDISWSPKVPIQGKSLKVYIRIEELEKNAIQGIWFNFRSKGENGFLQKFGDKKRKYYIVEIPGYELNMREMEYYVSAMDQSGQDIYLGSPESPLLLILQ